MPKAVVWCQNTFYCTEWMGLTETNMLRPWKLCIGIKLMIVKRESLHKSQQIILSTKVINFIQTTLPTTEKKYFLWSQKEYKEWIKVFKSEASSQLAGKGDIGL